jgi:hypothetical protein
LENPRNMKNLIVLLTLSFCLAACSTTPPVGWQAGGAPLVIPRARWVNGETLIDVDAEGVVLMGGRHVLTIDRAGRIYDDYNNPVALLQKDGFLLGTDDDPMGWVGGNEAILPGDEYSWLSMDQQGLLLRMDDEGEQRPFGQWMGCQQVTQQTCMLVSHVVGQRIMARRRSRRSGPSVGIGIGVGF